MERFDRSGGAPWDAVVVGAGPNGLTAAITLARQRHRVLVREGAATFGGGLRSAALTLPGYVHDVCAAVVPLAVGSPALASLPLAEHGVTLLHPEIALAHPLDDGSAATLYRSLARTADELGADGRTYQRLFEPLVADWQAIMQHILGPLHLPTAPLALSRFALSGLLPLTLLARRFRTPQARALLAGMAAHAILPLDRPISAAFALVLGLLGHAVGWPVVRGGSQHLADGLVSYLRTLGGELEAERPVDGLDELPGHRVALLDLTPRQILGLAHTSLPRTYRQQLGRYRYGPGVCKVDWALSEPIPWTAAACRRAGTVHVGGTLEEIAAAEAAVWRGEHPDRPFVLLSQPTLVDPSRAPAGRHTAWAYCHVPNGSTLDRTAAIEAQIERFAPGFTSRILGRATLTAAAMATYNPNYVGGDINGGVQDLAQLWTRPAARVNPYTTPNQRLFVCSSATPPGGGVHGMCGYHAATAATRRLR